MNTLFFACSPDLDAALAAASVIIGLCFIGLFALLVRLSSTAIWLHIANYTMTLAAIATIQSVCTALPRFVGSLGSFLAIGFGVWGVLTLFFRVTFRPTNDD